jgi:uncharacterized iron-regulated protein
MVSVTNRRSYFVYRLRKTTNSETERRNRYLTATVTVTETEKRIMIPNRNLEPGLNLKKLVGDSTLTR